ncbi:CTP synthase (UTP-ammonia lyase) [Bifidobacterium lemurum]|uniref:CTP synthase (UTP-ammonia lyase) n=1 Tax=Bifidobacterium lemurum TaxID=1603886 RepID=A0A261FW60_9BIFI|nr:CTP synthase [Bifidobacterium lemurum]OZG63420.1 CTP synthase (UTP-ammonia lyase) [Bifidobacterium lemurum]
MNELFADAEKAGRCVVGEDDTTRAKLRRRVKSGEAVCPYRTLYARAEYWNGLNAVEKTQHVVASLARRHTQWVFAGLSAAAMLGIDHSWSLHDDGAVTIATQGSCHSVKGYRKLRRIYMPSIPTQEVLYRGQKIHVTTVARTLVDCGLSMPFMFALALFDSAFRRQLVTEDEIVAVCDGKKDACGPVFRLLHYADPLSENGGESLCRAVIIEEGFAIPELQHVFVDPDNPINQYRVDYVWHCPDGRIVVLEYDGVRKYVDGSMTRDRTVAELVSNERSREMGLRRAGVHEIVRVFHHEVVDRTSLVMKLERAEVPHADMRYSLYERQA